MNYKIKLYLVHLICLHDHSVWVCFQTKFLEMGCIVSEGCYSRNVVQNFIIFLSYGWKTGSKLNGRIGSAL